MKTVWLALFCALGIGVLALVGRYASRDIGPAEPEQPAATLDVVYQGNRYAVAGCRMRVDMASNLVTATCSKAHARVSPAAAFDRARSSSWLDVHVVTASEALLFSDCRRYGEVVECTTMKTEPRGSGARHG